MEDIVEKLDSVRLRRAIEENAPVLRGVPWQRNCLTAGETIAVDASPHHPEPGQTSTDARVLHALGHPRALDQAGARAPDPLPSRLADSSCALVSVARVAGHR